ncbi:clasp N terminal-domain-containing protein [Sporodiniella umbellata]|nr:clasp N terminal-domain-containing protein [Sporodiniella umbellata]
MQKCYADKETEHNWEIRERSIIRIGGILRGNSPKAYCDVLVQGLRTMVDGVIKAVESLRTQLAVKALLLVGDIGIYLGKHLDTYICDQLLMCMMRCAGLTKKIVATASLQATITFIKHTNFYPKFPNMLVFSMNDKNTQVRLYTIQYTKTVLQTHAHRDHARALMDKTNSGDHFESVIVKGLNDATPAVREVCREAFWVFWEYWRERGDFIFKDLSPSAQKQLEKSKNNKPAKSQDTHPHPTGSLRAPGSLGKHEPSPSSSTLSNGSTDSADQMPRSVSRQNGSRLNSPMPYSSPSPPPLSTSPSPRKTRVPLNKKKSSAGLGAKRKPLSVMTLLNHDDIQLRIEGIQQLASKLSTYPYAATPNLKKIQLDGVDGEALRKPVFQHFEDPVEPQMYEALSAWACVSFVMLRLLNFEDYLPRLILDAHMDESARRSEVDRVRHMEGKKAFGRAKLFLQHENPDLADTLFTCLVQFGGFGSTAQKMPAGKRDVYKLPANRRKLTKAFLVWMDELLMPLIGLEPEIEEDVPAQYHQYTWTASGWFELDSNVRQCLDNLLPLVTTYNSGSLWHGPLVTFIKHLRLLQQPLFDSIMGAYDEYSVSKICRILGIHLVATPAPEPHLDSSPSSANQIPTVDTPSLPSTAEDSREVSPPLTKTLVEDTPLEPIESLPLDQTHAAQELTKVPSLDTKEADLLEPEEHQEKELETVNPIEPQKPPEETPVEETPVEETPAENSYTPREYDRRELEVINEYGEEDVVEYDEDQSVDGDEPSHERQWSPRENPARHLGSPPAEDIYTTKIKPESKSPDFSGPMYDKRLEEQGRIKSPIPDFFHPNMVPPLANHYPDPHQHPTENGFYENGTSAYSLHRASESSTPTSIADMTTSPRQPEEQPPPPVAQLQISEPNLEKYPVPQYVPFFSPEKVNYPCAVFQSNIRSNAATVSVRSGKDKAGMLYALVDKLKSLSSNTADNVNCFKKLTRLLKEVPIRRRWDQGGSEESGNETWSGGQGDGGNFVEVVQAILLYLNQPVGKHTVSALECTRQLAITQSGLFKVFERKSNEQGMTVESLLSEKLLELKSNQNNTICIAAEDALDALLSSLTPPTAFEMLMAFVVYRSVINPYEDSTISESRYHPVGTALNYVAKSVRELHDVFYVEEWLAKGAVNAFFKGMNSNLVNVRKACVEAIVAFHEAIGGDIYTCLADFREDQTNLIKHYVAKSLKKKTTLRNMRESHTFL